MKILGHKFVDFKDKDGNAVCGHSLFVSYHDDNVTGEATDKLWVKPDLMDTAVRDAGLLTAGECVGMEIDPTYNKYGKICAVAFMYAGGAVGAGGLCPGPHRHARKLPPASCKGGWGDT